MELDRHKHDVDVIERVLGGVHEALGADQPRRQVIDVAVPATNGYRSSSLELVVHLGERRATSDRRRF
jgi:hypothetical protein